MDNQSGQRVLITEYRPVIEGKATLIQRIKSNDHSEVWLVHFDGDSGGRNYLRRIYPMTQID